MTQRNMDPRRGVCCGTGKASRFAVRLVELYASVVKKTPRWRYLSFLVTEYWAWQFGSSVVVIFFFAILFDSFSLSLNSLGQEDLITFCVYVCVFVLMHA